MLCGKAPASTSDLVKVSDLGFIAIPAPVMHTASLRMILLTKLAGHEDA